MIRAYNISNNTYTAKGRSILDIGRAPELPYLQFSVFASNCSSLQFKMSVDYLLHESSVGYAIFQVVHQPDTVGNRLKEVQDSVQVFCIDKQQVFSEEMITLVKDLAKFGKMVKLVSFAPFQYESLL